MSKGPRLKTLGSRVATLDTRKAKPLPKERDEHLGTSKHKAWRAAVCERAGWRCEWIENGRRCEKRAPNDRMIADHVVERADGGPDLGKGQCLCVAHNTLKGLEARRQRMTKPTGG